MARVETKRDRELAACLRRHLESRFKPYKPEHRVWAFGKRNENGQDFAGYRTTESYADFEQTHVDLNILYINGEPVGWLTTINLHKNLRKRGHGRTLIEVAEEFFREQGCKKIQLSASGTNKGIWKHLGYTEVDDMRREKELT